MWENSCFSTWLVLKTLPIQSTMTKICRSKVRRSTSPSCLWKSALETVLFRPWTQTKSITFLTEVASWHLFWKIHLSWPPKFIAKLSCLRMFLLLLSIMLRPNILWDMWLLSRLVQKKRLRIRIRSLTRRFQPHGTTQCSLNFWTNSPKTELIPKSSVPGKEALTFCPSPNKTSSKDC